VSPPEKPTPTSPSTAKSHTVEDDFGDFSTQSGQDGFEDVDFGDFQEQARPKHNGGGGGGNNLMDFDDLPLPSKPTTKQKGFFALPTVVPSPTKHSSIAKPGPHYLTYRAHHLKLRPLCQHLRSSPSPSSTLSLLFPTATPLSIQADVLLSLLLFLSPGIQPLHDWGFLRQALLAAADRFDSACLVAFEMADSKGDEKEMAAAAESSWKVWDAGGGSRDQWECGRVWVEKREVFYETSKWDPLENIVWVYSLFNRSVSLNNSKTQPPGGGPSVKQLDFTPMDAFITHVLETFKMDAERATKVFPPAAMVVLSFCDRVANDVVRYHPRLLVSELTPDRRIRPNPAWPNSDSLAGFVPAGDGGYVCAVVEAGRRGLGRDRYPASHTGRGCHVSQETAAFAES